MFPIPTLHLLIGLMLRSKESNHQDPMVVLEAVNFFTARVSNSDRINIIIPISQAQDPIAMLRRKVDEYFQKSKVPTGAIQ